MHDMICYDVGALVQVATIFTALFGVMVIFGILKFSWDSLNDIFGDVPFLGRIWK